MPLFQLVYAKFDSTIWNYPFNFVRGDFEFDLGALQVHVMVEVQVI